MILVVNNSKKILTLSDENIDLYLKNVWHCCDLKIWSKSLKVAWRSKAQRVVSLYNVWQLSHVWCLKHWQQFPPATRSDTDHYIFSFFIQRNSLLSSRLTELKCHCSRTWYIILHEWLPFHGNFFNIHRSGVFTALTWLMPHETAAVSASSVYTIQSCTLSLHAKPHT